MENENFEKKPKKKVGKIILLVVILALVLGVVGVFAYTTINSKPEKVFEKTVSKMFEVTEEDEDIRSTRVGLEMSLDVESTDPNSEIATEIAMANVILKTIKAKATLEMDLDKKIFNENITILYQGDEVINIDALIKDKGMYLFLNDIYSKYIAIPTEYMEGIDLSTVFTETEVNEALISDIENIFIEKIKNTEFTQEETEIEIAGEESKVKKSSVELTQKEVLDISVDVLNKVSEHEKDAELKASIDEIVAEIKTAETTEENTLLINIYTKGLNNEIVKAELAFVNKEYDEVMGIDIAKQTGEDWKIALLMNEESTSIKDAEELFTIDIKQETENKGVISLNVEVPEEGMKIAINLAYNVENNAKINDRDVSNSISIDEITDADLQEMYTNIQDNEILMSIVGTYIDNMMLLKEAEEAIQQHENMLQEEQELQQNYDMLLNEALENYDM